MDKTEQYIKMCEKARKVQAIWHRPELIGTHPIDMGFGLHYEKGFDGSFYWDGNGVCCVDYEYETSYKKTDVWLPRQDQLQEMIYSAERKRPIDLICSLVSSLLASSAKSWYFSGALKAWYQEDCSMEQLWLAFVMKEKYKKTWDGENWNG